MVTDTVHDLAAQGLPRFRILETRNKHVLDAALSEDRAYAAYALGHLELGLFERSRFWIADGPTGAAVVMHTTAMGRTMFVGGDPAGVDAIVSLHPGPRHSYISTCAPEHQPVLARTHVISDALRMTRMAVTEATFAPVEGALRKLRGEDAGALNALYALDGAHAYYSADHIESGVCFGAFEGERLISVAGTHVVAPEISVGIVGNVFTHPAYRGRGLATRVTSRVTGELFDRGCALVALTVDPANMSAVSAYTRLGYVPGAAVVEARAQRRDALGLGAWLRRRAARRSGGSGEFGEVEEYATGRPPRDGAPGPGGEGATP